MLKLDKSNDVNDEQYWNIHPIVLTLEVLKLDKSNDVNDEQLLNILFISVTLEVSKPFSFVIDLIFDLLPNDIDVGAALDQLSK